MCRQKSLHVHGALKRLVQARGPQDSLEPRIGANRVESWIHLKSGKSRRMFVDGFLKPNEYLVFVFDAGVPLGKSPPIGIR
jgi:hypothetical protein